jgi:general secretion pathway protein D
MVTKRQIQGRGTVLVGVKNPAVARKVFIFICAVVVLLSGSFLFAAEQGAASGVARYRVFSLKHISAEQGKKYLAQAGVGTVSQLPGVNALLVTAQPEELIKASAILELVDVEEPFYIIKAITSASEVTNLPSNEQIATEVNDISIGTFSNPPSGAAKTKVILDVHNDAVIIVAPEGQLERIISAIEQLHRSEAQAPQSTEPNKSAEVDEASGAEAETITENELEKAEAEADAELKKIAAPQGAAGQADTESNEPNELFDKLLKSIAETEKEPVLQEDKLETEETATEEQAQQLSQPNAIAPALAAQAATGVPEANEPNEPSIDLKQAEESAPQATEGPQSAEHLTVEPNLPAEKPESEPNLKPVSEVRLPSPLPHGRGSYKPAPIADGNEMLELDLPEKLNVIDLVDLVGKYLQLDYMYDETQVKGEVSLKLQGPIKVKDLYPLLESVLKFRGFVMTRKDNLVTIVPAAEALGIDPVLHPEAGQVQLGDVVITRVFKLKHIDTASAQNLLTGMKLGTEVSPIPETGTLIITEYAYRMARIEELLQMIDQPGEPRQFKFRQLKYTMAATLAPKIKTLAEQLGTVSITIAAPTPAAPPARIVRGRPVPTPAPAAPAATAKPAVYLDADERTNRILMIGLEEQLAVVESLIDTLDVEQQDLRTLRLYDIQHVGADEVVKKLGELGIISVGKTTTGGKITAGARPSGPGAPAPAATAPAATAEVEPLVEQPQVVVIESTNSLLVNATPEQHIRIATIISFVDSETLKQAIPYVIYGLENQNPEDLAEVLQKFIQETIKDKEGKIEQTIKKTEEDIIIVPDKNTFSILVYASKKNQEWIGSLIKQLDKRRPQVLIDVTLVEISRTDQFDLDLQLASKLPSLSPGDTMDYVGSILGGAGKTTTFPKGTVAEAFSSPVAGVGQGFYSDEHIQVLLTAMQKKNYGRVLAKPKILVNDGQDGTIKTTNTTNILNQTIITPNQGNTQTSNTYTPYTAGITLTVTPNISEGDLLRLKVTMSRSDFLKTSSGAGAPPDSTGTDITTIVTVPNNRTIILGGLLKLNQSKGGNKVPVVGDVPILGGLFRSVSNSAVDTKLYVFVKANILRPEETHEGLSDIENISDRNAGALERNERKFQEYQDWPGIEPEPVDPLHVLESE